MNPSTIENIPGFLPGVILEVDEGFSTSKGTVLAEIENKRYGASIIVSPFSGQTSLEKAGQRSVFDNARSVYTSAYGNRCGYHLRSDSELSSTVNVLWE